MTEFEYTGRAMGVLPLGDGKAVGGGIEKRVFGHSEAWCWIDTGEPLTRDELVRLGKMKQPAPAKKPKPKNGNSYVYVDIDTGEHYTSAAKVAEALFTNEGAVRSAIDHGRKCAGHEIARYKRSEMIG